MHVLRLECAAGEKDFLIADLYSRGTAGIIEEDLPGGRAVLRAFFRERFPADDLAGHSPAWEPAGETNWVRRVMDNWDPLLVGKRFFLVPDWRDDPTPEGRIRLEVRPAMTLGTGYHATTQMCLEIMEQHLKPGDRFLDLGAGSGILSHAAWLLGERPIIAVDIDPEATKAAAGNLTRAGVPASLFTGSTRALSTDCADFLVANISAEGLIELCAEIRRCLSPRGIAVLSGFPPARAGEVRCCYETAGFRVLGSDERQDWACLTVEAA